MTRYEQWRANPSSVQPQAPASSTPSSLRCHAPLPYEQSSTEDDRARRERLDALLREVVYPADGARENHAVLRRRREQEVRRWVAGQRLLEQHYAAQAARLRQPTGQNLGVTTRSPVIPVSSLESPTR